MKIMFIGHSGVEIKPTQLGPDFTDTQAFQKAARQAHRTRWYQDTSYVGYQELIAEDRAKLASFFAGDHVEFVCWLNVPFGYLVLTR